VRLFVAVFPSDAVRDDLEDHLSRAGRKLRLTPADRWHITLSFLGEVPDEHRADVERALSGVATKGPITLRLVGGGQFGHGRSSAVWAGVEGDLATLDDLHQEIRAALAADGLSYDDRPLTPHLTLSYTRERALLSALEGYLSPQWTADEFVLVRSHYRDGGGYEPLRSWPLGP
jgi:RNA 2',3'-cyclic 3'-phosphodiesterase